MVSSIFVITKVIVNVCFQQHLHMGHGVYLHFLFFNFIKNMDCIGNGQRPPQVSQQARQLCGGSTAFSMQHFGRPRYWQSASYWHAWQSRGNAWESFGQEALAWIRHWSNFTPGSTASKHSGTFWWNTITIWDALFLSLIRKKPVTLSLKKPHS